MALVVQTNVMSLTAQSRLSESSRELGVSFEQLSTGTRINRAADDSANSQISTRLQGQFQGLNQAVRNANDGISVAQAAEGALSSVERNIQRVRELLVQSENGILSAADKEALNKEASALLSEIDRIAENTEFGGKKLLDGTFQGLFSDGANQGQTMELDLTKIEGGFSSAALGLEGLNVATNTLDLDEEDDSNIVVSGARTIPVNAFIFSFENSYTAGERSYAVSNDGGVSYTEITVNFTGNQSVDSVEFVNAVNAEVGTNAIRRELLAFTEHIRLDGTHPDFRIALNSATTDEPLFGINGFEGTYTRSSATVFEALDTALELVSETRAELGAKQNAFQSSMRNMMSMAENVGGATSKLYDTDYVETTARLTKEQIIQQSTISMMGQAAQVGQSALFLLQR